MQQPQMKRFFKIFNIFWSKFNIHRRTDIIMYHVQNYAKKKSNTFFATGIPAFDKQGSYAGTNVNYLWSENHQNFREIVSTNGRANCYNYRIIQE